MKHLDINNAKQQPGDTSQPREDVYTTFISFCKCTNTKENNNTLDIVSFSSLWHEVSDCPGHKAFSTGVQIKYNVINVHINAACIF